MSAWNLEGPYEKLYNGKENVAPQKCQLAGIVQNLKAFNITRKYARKSTEYLQ